MKYRLRLTDEAADRLLSIAEWYAETSQSLSIALAWYDGFLDVLENLTDDPIRGAVAAENNLFEFELREIYYGSGKRITHRALYRVVNDTVEVLTTRHHAERPLERDDLAEDTCGGS
jgi:plasmid stabilization system protein ParE